MPLSVVESPNDWDLFEPRPAGAARPASKKRKLNGESHQIHVDGEPMDRIEGTINGVGGHRSPAEPSNSAALAGEKVQDFDNVVMAQTISARQTDAEEPQEDQKQSNSDTVMGDTKSAKETTGIDDAKDTLPNNDEPNEGRNRDDMPQDTEDAAARDNQDPDELHVSGESSPAPPPRRITRALAAGTNGNSGAPTPPLSPSPTLTSSDSSLLQVDPIFLLPPVIHAAKRTSALYGLPADEAAETRKLLTAYIQKQEECVRGLETVAAKLISALKLRKEVWDMCKAEGHVGELSDGEDWVDAEAWGLKEGELRKGRFEEEDIQEEREAIGGGRKGKRRRREQN